MPFEQLPVLIINDDYKLAQANTICRFLANIFKLNGKSEIENISCDMIVEQLKECADVALHAMSEINQIKKIQMSNKFMMDILPKTLNGFEKILSQNSGKYIVGNSLTVADLALINGWEWLDHASRQVLESYHLVKCHESFIRSIPEVSQWLKKQKPLTVLKKV